MAVLPLLEPPPLIDDLAALGRSEREQMLRAVATPLAHGRQATFVHLGDADAVEVRHFMARFPAIPRMRRVAAGAHAVTVALPARARVEYKVAITKGGRTIEQVDTFNPYQATDPFGANSVAFGPGYVTPWWATPAATRAGAIRRGFVASEAFGRRRFVRWYHADGDQGRLPLLVVHDGGDFIDHAAIVTALDRLVAAGAIRPVVAALVDPGDRLAEYTDDPRHADFVTEVVAAAVRRHGASPDPDNHIFVGASLGAVAALSAAWRGTSIGGLVLLSGSFVTALGGPMQRGPQFSPVIDFMNRFTADPGRPAARIYQACGEYEGLAPDNRVFTPVLESTGADVVYQESPDGHHWHNWRDRLAAALTHTLPSTHPAALGTVRT